MTCAHPTEPLYDFDVPGIGPAKLCWECRREIVLRCHLYEPMGLMSLDMGSLGYRCRTCNGEYTSTWVGNCVCPGRKESCEARAETLRRWRQFAELTMHKPKVKKERAA